MSQNRRKRGRPNLPKDEAKGKIVLVRIDPDDLKLVKAATRAAKQGLSEWIRNALRSAAEVQMFRCTLHEAMQIVLGERSNLTATTPELSEEIERRKLYMRKDGKAARAQQINARARKYPHIFEIDGSGSVRLIRPVHA